MFWLCKEGWWLSDTFKVCLSILQCLQEIVKIWQCVISLQWLCSNYNILLTLCYGLCFQSAIIVLYLNDRKTCNKHEFFF